MPRQLLFETPHVKLYDSDFLHALQQAGIAAGDVVFVHSDIRVFGKLALFDRRGLCQALVDAINLAIGSQGTLIMPTFTYSFCNAAVYDVEKSPSQVGALTEYYRRLPTVQRTLHPIFSAAMGGKEIDFFYSIDEDSFGWQSIFGKLHARRGKLVFLGTSLSACTYIHHIEQICNVPYRFLKTFSGTIKNGNAIYPSTASYFVRYLDKNITYDLSRLQTHLLDLGLMTRAHIGESAILVVEAATLFDEGCNLLKLDPNYFLKEPFQP